MVVQSVEDPGRMADLVASNLTLKVPEAQELLELDDPIERLTRVNQTLEKEIGILEVQSQIQTRAKEEMSKTQRDYFLREQLRQIQQRARRRRRPRRGDRGAARARSRRRACPTRRAAEADKQLRRLEQMHAESAEAGGAAHATSTWLIELPWNDRQRGHARPRRRAHGSSTRTTTTSSTSRIASSTTWRCASCAAARTGRSSASSARPASARPRWADRSRARSGASSCASRWAACATRRRSAATAAPTSARCPGASSRRMKQAGTDNPVVAARRGRQARRRLPRRSVGGAARGARPRAEPHLPRPLPGRALRSVARCCSSPPPTCRRASRRRCAIAWRRCACPATARRRSSSSPSATWCPSRSPRRASPTRRSSIGRDRCCARSSPSTRARRGCASWSGWWRSWRARSPARRRGRRARRAQRAGKPRAARRSASTSSPSYLGPPRYIPDEKRGADEIGIVNGLAWTPYGGEVLHVEAQTMAGKGTLDPHRPARRRDEGVGAGRAVVRARARRCRWGCAASSTPSARSTSTCPRAACPRTARRPASPWPARWSR